MNRRVGIGWDLHRLEPGEGLAIAGVEVDAPLSARGHSDADAALHAIIDALLGAAGLGDIGKHFPPDEPRWEDVDSLELLERTVQLIREENLQVVNLDVVVNLEAVKLAAYRQEMNKKISVHFPEAESINLKFKTSEGLGPVGREEAVEARAVVLLEKT